MDDSRHWTVDAESLRAFGAALAEPASDAAWFALRRAAESLSLAPGFDRLLTLDANTIRELPHQIDVALRVLRPPMRGRAILADEVGLGKTIEAAIILKELEVRGLARRVLILTPASLVQQWKAELETKFLETFGTPESPGEWRDARRAIVSLNRARGKRHASEILKHRWDLVIVDEAHKVRNHRSATYRFLQQIERNFILLLTATPLQNDLRELYNLVTLLRPGQLGTWPEFKRRFVARGDARRAKNPEALRELTHQVMVRTRRSSVAHVLSLPRRRPRHPEIVLTDAEAALYRRTASFARALYREGFVRGDPDAGDRRRRRRTGRGIFTLEVMRLCRRLCSSPWALAHSLRALAGGEYIVPDYRQLALRLAEEARSVESQAKLDALMTVLDEGPDERLIVFSEHLPTIRVVERRVREAGRPVVVFTGGLSMAERSQRLARFRDTRGSVFIATRAGSEGLNLQFCNRLVNYELPWNPMVIEQRIGRVHRIGQTRDVHIINFAASGTIESRILLLLDQKIRLFELVVGELDAILGRFGGAETLERRLADAFLEADSDEAFEAELARIGEDVEASREAGIEQERLASEIASEDNAGRLEREFRALTIPSRVRLGYGTVHMVVARGVEAKRHQLGLHVGELLEALEATAEPEPDGRHPEYGPLVRLVGVTGRGRAVEVLVQADRLPMALVDIDADAEAPLPGPVT